MLLLILFSRPKLVLSLMLHNFFFEVYFIFNFVFLGLHAWHMEVPRLGVKSELYLLAYTTAIATWDPSLFCDIHHSSQQHQILNPLSGARNWTQVLWILVGFINHWAMMVTPLLLKTEQYSTACTYHILLTHSSINKHWAACMF